MVTQEGCMAEVTVPIETDPGEEAQADWSDCTAWGRAWGLGVLHCFGAILAWSRRRFWWFAASVDREHTLEGMVRFFEDVGGVAGVMRIDNMGALVARSHPRLVVHPPGRAGAAGRVGRRPLLRPAVVCRAARGGPGRGRRRPP